MQVASCRMVESDRVHGTFHRHPSVYSIRLSRAKMFLQSEVLIQNCNVTIVHKEHFVISQVYLHVDIDSSCAMFGLLRPVTVLHSYIAR